MQVSLKPQLQKKQPNFLLFHDTYRQTLGRAGEQRAVTYLKNLGWQIVDQNWRTSSSEVDIIALDSENNDCVIVEVKSFSKHDTFDQTSGWNWRKKRALKKAAQKLLKNPPDWLTFRNIRIDLMIDCAGKITHFRNITWE